MMAGADEPATLSGLCQPMAKNAMVQEEVPVRPDSMSLSPKQSGVGDAMLRRAVGPSGARAWSWSFGVSSLGNMGQKGGTTECRLRDQQF